MEPIDVGFYTREYLRDTAPADTGSTAGVKVSRSFRMRMVDGKVLSRFSCTETGLSQYLCSISLGAIRYITLRCLELQSGCW
uniref:Uncharacterized protein n=1 Tax=Amphimedon queenslandica TaxID=400682 RepID=A0A1X7UU95_AMPQE